MPETERPKKRLPIWDEVDLVPESGRGLWPPEWIEGLEGLLDNARPLDWKGELRERPDDES